MKIEFVARKVAGSATYKQSNKQYEVLLSIKVSLFGLFNYEALSLLWWDKISSTKLHIAPLTAVTWLQCHEVSPLSVAQ